MSRIGHRIPESKTYALTLSAIVKPLTVLDGLEQGLVWPSLRSDIWCYLLALGTLLFIFS